MGYSLSKLSKKCEACPQADSCYHKKMEMCALAELPPKMCADAGLTATISASAPILRERIESPLSSFAYRDELEKALNDALFRDIFLMHGA